MSWCVGCCLQFSKECNIDTVSTLKPGGHEFDMQSNRIPCKSISTFVRGLTDLFNVNCRRLLSPLKIAPHCFMCKVDLIMFLICVHCAFVTKSLWIVTGSAQVWVHARVDLVERSIMDGVAL